MMDELLPLSERVSAQMELPIPEEIPLMRLPDGTLRVIGTRIPLERIVHAYWQGQTAEQFHLRSSSRISYPL